MGGNGFNFKGRGKKKDDTILGLERVDKPVSQMVEGTYTGETGGTPKDDRIAAALRKATGG
jgi:hypothetical protein